MTKGTRSGWGVSVTSRPLFTPGKDPVPIVQEAGWAPGTVWTGAENLAPIGIRSPDRPARSQSLYRLRYPVHIEYLWSLNIMTYSYVVPVYSGRRVLHILINAWYLWPTNNACSKSVNRNWGDVPHIPEILVKHLHFNEPQARWQELNARHSYCIVRNSK
jgi:hypothetical protein